jgi:hypothetical protein
MARGACGEGVVTGESTLRGRSEEKNREPIGAAIEQRRCAVEAP